MENLILKHALKNAVTHEGKAIAKAIIPKVIGEDTSLKENIKELVKNINKIVKKVNSMSIEEQEKLLKEKFPEMLGKKEEKKGLSELPNVRGKVTMRLAPFPSGALHIGNVRSMILNDEYVKKYGGELLLVIDDTIGSEQKPIVKEAYKLIPEALKWLKIKYNPKIIYKSDRLELFYKYGEKLIKKGAAYVCECPNALIRDYRVKGIECVHRGNTVAENLRKWKAMLKGEYEEGEAVVRLKTNMKDKDPAFRDRVLFRISKRRHERVGNKYFVWPMLEMSWAVDDMLLKITHIIRGKELMIEGRMENFIWDVLGYKKRPEMVYIGLLKIEGAKISKSKARAEVESGVYSGWDDPRTWSIQSLKRRGFKPEAIREFILSLGMSQSEIKVPIESLYAINRRLIDKEALRYFFVKDPVRLIVSNCPEMKIRIPMHPEIKKSRTYVIEKGINEFWISRKDVSLLEKEGRVRLKDAMNIELISTGETVKAKYAKNQKEVYNIRKIQFVIKGVDCKVLKPDGTWDSGLCEAYCKRIRKNEVIQFERYGFCKLEKKGKELDFIYTHP